jgi:predicted enzyme involved in methoxymalonyl-ACP biosynthesis
MFDALIEQCQERGIQKIVGMYIPSKKNSMVAGHYADLGFKSIGSSDGRERWSYEVPAKRDSLTTASSWSRSK